MANDDGQEGGGGSRMKAAIKENAPSNKNSIGVGSEALTEVGVYEPSIGNRPLCFATTTQEIICLAILTFAAASSSITQGLTQVTTAVIGEDLQMQAAAITWINAAQTLSTSSFLLFAGSVADLIGRKKLLISSLVCYSILTAIAGAATNAIWFNVMRGLQGLAIAAAIPASAGVLGFSYGPGSIRKNRAFACFSAGNPLGFSLGTITAGLAARIFNWRAGFYLWAILFALFSVLAYFVVPADGPRDNDRKLDPLGAFLIVAGLMGVIASLTLASEAKEGWKTPYILILLIFGVFLSAAFIFWQNSRFNKEPMMPWSIFNSRDFVLITVIISTGFAAFSSSFFWIALYMQTVNGYSTLATAVRLLPATISGLIVNVLAALLLHRINNKLLLLAGSIGYLAGNILFSFAAFPNSSYWAFIFTGQILSVYGADLDFTVANMYILSASLPSQQSLASGVFNTCTQIGNALGLAISSALFQAINGTSVLKDDGNATSPAKYRAYRAAFYLNVGLCSIAFVLIPFLRIGRQGHSPNKIISEGEGTDMDKVKS